MSNNNRIIRYRNLNHPNSRDEISIRDVVEETKVPTKTKNKCLCISIIIAIIAAIAVILGVALLILQKKNNKNNDNNGNNEKIEDNQIDQNSPTIQKPLTISREEAMKAFKSNFNINTKADTLTQLMLKSTQNYSTITDGIESSYSIFTKAKYDIYTLNESLPGKDKDFYSKKYTSVITVNSLCSEFYSSKENDCELEEYLDLNIKSSNNLRKNDEVDKEQIKNVLLPICLIEHTDTNIILSVTCPETLDENVKNGIITAFQSIKPDSFNGIIEDDNIAGTTIEKKENKIYINSFDTVCNDYEDDPTINITCETTRNIITDNNGNLISSKKISKTETIKDKDNKFSTNFISIFEDISKQNSNDFDPQNYKSNLKTVFDLTNSLMKKENYISEGSFEGILEDIIKENNNTDNNSLRHLTDEKLETPGVNEQSVFSKSIYNIKMALNLKNDIGLGKEESAKAITNFNTGERNQEISNTEANTQLYDTLNKFITLSKAGNKLASSLFEELNEPLLNLRNEINTYVNDLNNLLAFKQLAAIFDSTLASEQLEKLPYTFVAAAENLYNGLDDLNNNVPYIISDMKKKLKNDVSNFLFVSHEMLYNIFQNLTSATNSLSSKKSKIAEISSYYLNDTDTSFIDIIKKAKDIMDNYYQKEKELIEPLVDEIINDFPNKVMFDQLKNIQSILDSFLSRLESGSLLINLASNEDYKNVIKNLYNSNIKLNEIISNVQQQFKECINLQSNGYFETQKELEQKRKSYGEICERAMNISYTLDHNDLIDKKFDEIMKYFREQFIVLLKYMDKSKIEKFPLKNNVLSSSIFEPSYIKEIDDKFKKEKINILDFVKDENKKYLEAVNEKINSIKSKSESNFEQLINNIQVELSDLNLNNLDIKYNEILSITFNSIETLISNNYNKASQYLNDVIKAGTTHRTQAFINKYNTYINSFMQIRSYIQNDLKNNLANKYKNIINQIRINLQSIKSSSIIKKYSNYLPFTENHLRIIETLFERLDKHISDKIFNSKFLPTINIYVNSLSNNLNNKIQNLKNLFNSQSKFAYSSSKQYDYYKNYPIIYRCCVKRTWRHCWKRGPCGIINNYVGYTVKSTNNHLSLESINFNKYTNNFDLLYNSLYKRFENSITLYNGLLIQLDAPLESIKQDILNKNPNSDYLNEINENVKSIINDKLGNNLLQSSYNYYKNKINEKIPIELNDILEQWKNVYDKVYEKINLNIENFKSSIEDFSLMSGFYLNTYSQNITYDYSDSIVNIVKNDFNYTIKYYYDLILSKVKKSYSYILNNIPSNKKPFDEILIKRTNEIKNSYNNLINQIQTSKDEVLKLEKQLNYLKVNEKNFFLINSYTTNNAKTFNEQIGKKIEKIENLSNENVKEDTEELFVSRFYLENAQNGKQIKEIYDSVNKATFIDLQKDEYQKLIEEIWEIEQDEFINNIKNVLTNSNEEILNNFKYEKEEYIKKLQDKVYKEFYTKEDLEKEINLIYSNGLKILDSNFKDIIYGYLKESLNKIKSHISNEANRLNDKLTSYSNNYKLIEERLNNYKKSIFDQFYSTILSVVNEFYSNVNKKFYKDYIEKNLNEYQQKAKEYNFKEFKFLNVTLNLKEIINENIEIILNEYKNLTITQINYLNEKNIQSLNNLFEFSNLNNTINNEIDNMYNSILLPVLKSKAIYNSGDEQISDYDLSNIIIKDINNFINEKISQTKQLIEKMKGNNYLDEKFSTPPDFSLVEREVFNPITSSFGTFTNTYYKQELKEFKKVVLENLINNFKIIIDNFVPTFGKDFFDRILKYNEIQKIKSLYKNLKYSLIQTTIYYITLCDSEITTDSNIKLPKDVKLKILTLNNLDSTIKSKNKQVISTLNKTLNEFFEENKNYIVEKYITEMKNNENIILNFNNDIKEMIEQIMDGKRFIFENEYLNLMNTYIKGPFVEQYTKAINKETDDMSYYIEKRKQDLRVYLNEIFSLDIDNVLSDIDNELNNTLKAVNEYSSHFNTFKISNDIIQFLDNYGKDIIYPKYQGIKNKIDENTKDLVIKNLEKNSDDFKKEYSIEKFENKIQEINVNLTNSFNQLNNTLRKYGTIEQVYEKNLNKELGNYIRIRRLDEFDNEKMIYKQQSSDYKLDKTFQELKNSSLSIKEFIQSLNLFSNFNDKINKYINDINYQYGISEILIKKDTQNYDELSTKLNNLKSYSLNYYNKTNSTYHKMKKNIIKYIFEIDELIQIISNITYNTIANKYIEFKNEFNSFKNKTNEERQSISVEKYTETKQEKTYHIETTIEKYLINNEFNLDFVFEEGDIKKPKVLGNVINENKPKKFLIDFYSLLGKKCGRYGREINADFKNISLTTLINFIGGLNDAKINTNFNLEEYNIDIKFYEQISIPSVKYIDGIKFSSKSCVKKSREAPDGETENEIVASIFKNINETYTY